MVNKKVQPKKKKKSPLKLGKVAFVGTMTIDECFQKALEPYFSKAK